MVQTHELVWAVIIICVFITLVAWMVAGRITRAIDRSRASLEASWRAEQKERQAAAHAMTERLHQSVQDRRSRLTRVTTTTKTEVS